MYGRASEATLIEASAHARLAAEAGKSYGIGAIVVTHGEIVCSGPKYAYPYAPDGVHLVTEGYRRLGEKTGQIYFERVVCGHSWQPLMPISAARDADGIRVRFHVPFGPLLFYESLPVPHAESSERRAARGFEVRMHRNAQSVGIRETCIDGDSLRIICDTFGDGPVDVAYAMTAPTGEPFKWKEDTKEWTGTYRWGCLMDSDPFVGVETGTSQPNRCVAFEMKIE